MTLEEVKKRVFALIEELDANADALTDDDDYKKKINYCIDTKQSELARLKRIPASTLISVTAGDEINLSEELDNFYKLDSITGVDYSFFDSIITFNETGTAIIHYYKYPKMIDENTNNSYKFELSRDVLEILCYGVAADLLKADASAQYGQVYENAYETALRKLDINIMETSYEIGDGLDV